MPRGALKVLRALPTDAGFRSILAQAASEGLTYVSSDSEPLLAGLAGLATEGAAFEFLSLPDLLSTLLANAGETRMRSIAPRAGLREAVSQACAELPDGSPFKSSAAFAGFHRMLVRTLDSLRSSGIRSDRLRAAAREADPLLRAKLEDLATIGEEVDATLEALGWEDVWGRVLRFLALPDSPNLTKANVLFFARRGQGSMLRDWAVHAARLGARVCLVLDCQASGSTAFAEASETALSLGSGVGFVGPGHPLGSVLFTDDEPTCSFECTIRVAPDTLAEVEWAARHACFLHDAGTPWERIAIYARSFEEYGPLMAHAAGRFGFPLSTSAPQRIDANGLVGFVIDLLRVSVGQENQNLTHLPRSSYAPRGSDGEPLSFGPFADAPGAEADALLAEWSHWLAASGSPAPRKEWVARLRSLAETSLVAPWLSEESPTSSRDGAAWVALLGALEARASVRAVRGSDRLDYPLFLDEFATVAESETYSVAPARTGVRLVSSSDGLVGVDALIVVGMLEGAFPRRRSEDPILADPELEFLSAATPGVGKLRDSRAIARGERDEFIRVCSAPATSLALSYPVVGEDRDNVPAFYLDEVLRVAPSTSRKEYGTLDWTPTPEDSTLRADVELSAAIGAEKARRPITWASSPAALSIVRAAPSDALSPSELRDALACPFQFAFKRRIGLRASGASDRWRMLGMLPQRVGLPAIADPEQARAALLAALDEQVHDGGGGDADSRLTRSGGDRVIAAWVESEFAARQLWPKEPGSVRPHASFGGPGLAEELPMKGGAVRLRGALTAVSRMGPYAVGHLLGARRALASAASADALSDADVLEIGLYLWSLSSESAFTALEVQALEGDRVLYVLPRDSEFDLTARVDQGLRVLDLGERADFYPRVKTLLARALQVAREGTAEATPGEHCTYCDFGEVCRVSQAFGEEVGEDDAEA